MFEDFIKRIPIFANLPETEMRSLKQASQECQFQPGEVLFKEGAESDYFYLLIEGEIEIIKSFGTSYERPLGIRGQGEILGEMSKFCEDGSHTATGRAHTPCRLLKVPFSWLDSALIHAPQLTYDLMRLYVCRLEFSENLTIRDLREKNQQLTQAYEDLKIAQAAMIEKEKLDQEMRLANKIQLSILPKSLPQFTGVDFGALMVPAKLVGGDFYDWIPLTKTQVGIVIGDVCGKGMPAALLMALTYSSVRIEALRHTRPGDALRAVNHHLKQIDCANMFVTLLYGILDCETMRFDYARAGHPSPVLLDDQNHSIQVPYDYGQAVGIFDTLIVDEACVSIPGGGSLLLYSDGLSETIEDHQDSPDLLELCTSVLDHEAMNAQAFCERLWMSVGGSSAESWINDDFTVVAVKTQMM